MIDEKEFEELKKRVAKATQARDKAAGALENVMERLQKEFGCKTLAQAEKKVTVLAKEADQAEAAYDRALVAFEEEWEEYIKDD